MLLSVRCLSVLSVTFVHYGQMVGRIKMKLGMHVGLGPGRIVLDGDSAPTAAPPHFRPMPTVAKRRRSSISATAELLYFISDVTGKQDSKTNTH